MGQVRNNYANALQKQPENHKALIIECCNYWTIAKFTVSNYFQFDPDIRLTLLRHHKCSVTGVMVFLDPTCLSD